MNQLVRRARGTFILFILLLFGAAQIATRLLFALIFCIFPALLVVLLGPAVIQIFRAMTPAAGA